MIPHSGIVLHGHLHAGCFLRGQRIAGQILHDSRDESEGNHGDVRNGEMYKLARCS